MKLFIKLNVTFFILLSVCQPSSAEEAKKCEEYKKLSKEYLICVTKKLGKSFKIDGKSPKEVKEEIKSLKNKFFLSKVGNL